MIEYLFWVMAGLMSSFGILYFYLKLLNKKNKVSYKIILFLVIGVLLTTFIKYRGYTFINIISYFVFYLILFYLVSKDKLKVLMYYSIIIWIYGALFDFLSMLIISFLGLFFDFSSFSSWSKVVTTTCFSFFFIVSSYIPILKSFTNKTVNLLCEIKYFDLLLMLFFLFTFIVGAVIVISVENLKLTFIIIILFLLMAVLFILIIHCKNIDYEFNILVKNLQINNSFYTNINDEYSMFKHNLMAKLLSVKSVSNKKARILIDELIKDFNSNIDYHKLILNLPYGLDGVINQKLNDCSDKLNIKISNNLQHDLFDVLSPKRYNVLVEKLSLLIDNAINASLESVEKILIINIIEEDNLIKIEVKNTFSGELDIDNIGNLHYSTKGNRHGFGLYSILRNNEVSVNVKIINEYFVGEIIAKFM